MRKTLTAALATATLLLGTVTIAAADICLRLDLVGSGGSLYYLNTLVLKNFSVPGKGVCKPSQGFYMGGPFWVTGTACGSSNGQHITFFHTGLLDDGRRVITDKMKLDRATMAGYGTECETDEGYVTSCYYEPMLWREFPCAPATIPVP